MAKPVRLRLKRAKGFNLQKLSKAANGLGAVPVTRPGRWGNPFRMGQDKAPDGKIYTPATSVAAFRKALTGGKLPYMIDDVRRELRGKNLACWCAADAPCHADVLLEFANKK